jgi:3',5'-cyclic AMP phosphodiesterase CpdA
VTVITRSGPALLVIGVLLMVAIFAFRVDPRGPEPSSPVAATTALATAPATAPPEPASALPASGAPPSIGVHPAASPGVPGAVLVGAGDIAECSEGGDAATAALVETLNGIVFTLGDNAYERGTFDEFQACYGPTWGRPSIKDRTRPVVGNHEYETRGAEGYFRYFGAAAGDPAEGWYAYDAGAWRIYVLNSNCAEVDGCQAGSPQERWLRDDLARNPRACVGAMWHHPRFSSGDHGNHDGLADLWRALQDAGAELVLSGHDHSYERFGPQDAAGMADEDGLVQLVVGTGGRDPRGFPAPKPNSLVRASPVFGVVRLELQRDGYALEFLAVPGSDFTDVADGRCD